jgi:hypothetical protein
MKRVILLRDSRFSKRCFWGFGLWDATFSKFVVLLSSGVSSPVIAYSTTQRLVPENSAIAFVRLPGSCSLSMRVLSLTVEQVVSQHSPALLCSCSARCCFGQVTWKPDKCVVLLPVCRWQPGSCPENLSVPLPTYSLLCRVSHKSLFTGCFNNVKTHKHDYFFVVLLFSIASHKIISSCMLGRSWNSW